MMEDRPYRWYSVTLEKQFNLLGFSLVVSQWKSLKFVSHYNVLIAPSVLNLIPGIGDLTICLKLVSAFSVYPKLFKIIPTCEQFVPTRSKRMNKNEQIPAASFDEAREPNTFPLMKYSTGSPNTPKQNTSRKQNSKEDAPEIVSFNDISSDDANVGTNKSKVAASSEKFLTRTKNGKSVEGLRKVQKIVKSFSPAGISKKLDFAKSSRKARSPAGRLKKHKTENTMHKITNSSQYRQIRLSYLAYKDLMEVEGHYMVSSDFLDKQEDLSPGIRAVLISWLVDLHIELAMTLDALHLAVKIVDRYLSKQRVSLPDLKAVGLSALRISSREHGCDKILDARLDKLGGGDFSDYDIVMFETQLMQALNFATSPPISLSYVSHLLQICDITVGTVDELHENLVYYILSLALLRVESLQFPPSIQAASAVNVASKIVHRGLTWDISMSQFSGNIREEDLKDCEALFRDILKHDVAKKENENLRNIKQMFSTSTWGRVALEAENFQI